MKILTNYTLKSNSFTFFSCFSSVLECCKCARWDFTAQLVWWCCAFVHLQTEHWLQKMRFIVSNASSHIVQIRGGQTCSMEEPFAENQKYQRAAKPVCNVNTNMVKNASFIWCTVIVSIQFCLILKSLKIWTIRC